MNLNDLKKNSSNGRKRLLVIDGSHMMFRTIHQSVNSGMSSLNYTIYSFLRSIIKELKAYPSTPIIIFDKGGSDYRTSIYPEYKGNRKDNTAEEDIPVFTEIAGQYAGMKINDWSIPMEALQMIFTNTPEGNSKGTISEVNQASYYSALKSQYTLRVFSEARKILMEYLPYIGLASITRQGIEADDYGFLIPKFTSENYEGRLITSDQDWILSVRSRFSLHNPMSDQVVEYNDFIKWNPMVSEVRGEDYDWNELMVLVKAINGDGGDNIFGFAGIGGKGADELARKLAINGIESHPDNSKIKELGLAKKFNSIIDEYDRFLLNKKLVGFYHVDGLIADTMKKDVENALSSVHEVSQLKFMQLCSLIESNDLPNSFNALKSFNIKLTDISDLWR